MSGKTPTSAASSLWIHWLALLKEHPRKTVLVDAATNAAWSPASLTRAAEAFFDRLCEHPSGTRFAFRLPNGPGWLALFLAAQRAGLTAVPLDGAMPRDGCLDTARRVGAAALYLDGEFHPLGKIRARRDPVSCLKITSGTASIPKSIACRAEHLLADGRNVIRTMGLRAGDRNLAIIPLGHSYGLGNLVLPLLLQGTAIVTAAEYVPRQLLEWIDRHRVTVFPGVPALFRVLAALPRGSGDAKSLRTVISAGAMLPPMVAQAFFERFGVKIHNFYGSSETGGICYDRAGAASLNGRSVGRPLAGVKVTLKAGRVTVTSAAVATRTGRWTVSDRGEWNRRGELVLLGRSARDANIGGKKVHPLEVERALRLLPEITDAVVWTASESGRDYLIAAVETTCSRAGIERGLAAHLPAWKMPKSLIVGCNLPRTARGKLDLASLKQQGGSQA